MPALPDDTSELRDTLDRLHVALDDLAVRGLRSSGPHDLAKLAALRDELAAAGAAQIADRLSATLDAVRADDRTSSAKLLGAMTAARLFDRMLTVEVAQAMLTDFAAPQDA